jgi:hypothetical protein
LRYTEDNEMPPYIYQVVKVASLRKVDGGLLVAFSPENSALLPGGVTEFQSFARRLQLAQQADSPVAVSVDSEGEVCDVAGIHRDVVLGVEEKSNMPGAAVWFGKMDGMMALLKKHPRFEPILALLHQAVACNHPVWYVTRSGCILDILQLSPEEEEALAHALPE